MFRVKIQDSTRQNIIAYTVSGALLILFFFLISNFSLFFSWISKISYVVVSFIIGFALAFVLTPAMTFLEDTIFQKWTRNPRLKRTLTSVFCMIVALGIISAFIALTFPSLIESVSTLTQILPEYLTMAEEASDKILAQLNVDQSVVELITQYSEELFTTVVNLGRQYLPQVLNYSLQIGSWIIKVLISIIIALYIMIDRERFILQFKKICYAVFNQEDANNLVDFSRVCSSMFKRFIIGKMVDSMIIGILCYIGLMVLQIPYALLLSVIVGITNMIPVFGPFIGAVPGIFILFIVDPLLTVWFALFIFALQQLDGNVIGPAILGDSLGLPSLWIMFAIVVGGGFFGVIGMFLGVPLFAVIYFYIKQNVEKRIEQKQPVMK